MTERERLINLLKQNNACAYMDCEACMMTKKNLQCIPKDITDCLLDNGVIVPPCKVGDTVYVDNRCIYSEYRDKDTVSRCEVISISRTRKQLLVKIAPAEARWKFSRYNLRVPVSAFGKTVFLSRKDAYKALKECNND